MNTGLNEHCRDRIRDRMAVGPMGEQLFQEGNLAPGSNHGSWEGRQAKQTLTHFTDGKGAGIASVDLGCTTPWKVKQLHQARYHLILLLCMAQSAVATKTPGEDSLLGVQDQLQGEETQTGTCRSGLLPKDLGHQQMQRSSPETPQPRRQEVSRPAGASTHFLYRRILFSSLKIFPFLIKCQMATCSNT